MSFQFWYCVACLIYHVVIATRSPSITGSLNQESTVYRWNLPVHALIKSFNAGLWVFAVFVISLNTLLNTVVVPGIWDAVSPIWYQYRDNAFSSKDNDIQISNINVHGFDFVRQGDFAFNFRSDKWYRLTRNKAATYTFTGILHDGTTWLEFSWHRGAVNA